MYIKDFFYITLSKNSRKSRFTDISIIFCNVNYLYLWNDFSLLYVCCIVKQRDIPFLNDRTKFEQISLPLIKYTQKMEDKVNNFLRKVQNVLTLPNLKELFASGSSPGILYGLPKIHKPNFSSNFNSDPFSLPTIPPSFKLARALVPVPSHLTRNCYTVDNIQAFVSSIKNITNYLCIHSM